MPTCAVKGCGRNSSNKNLGADGVRITFHQFPSDEDEKKRWAEELRKAGKTGKNGEKWSPNINSKICSCHFQPHEIQRTEVKNNSKRLITIVKKPAVPSIFPKIPNIMKNTENKMVQETSKPLQDLQSVPSSSTLAEIDQSLTALLEECNFSNKELKFISPVADRPPSRLLADDDNPTALVNPNLSTELHPPVNNFDSAGETIDINIPVLAPPTLTDPVYSDETLGNGVSTSIDPSNISTPVYPLIAMLVVELQNVQKEAQMYQNGTDVFHTEKEVKIDDDENDAAAQLDLTVGAAGPVANKAVPFLWPRWLKSKQEEETDAIAKLWQQGLEYLQRGQAKMLNKNPEKVAQLDTLTSLIKAVSIEGKFLIRQEMISDGTIRPGKRLVGEEQALREED